MARLTTQDRRGATNDGNKRFLLLSVTFTVECFSPWLFHVRLQVFASIPILSSVMKQSRPDHTGVVSHHGRRPRISTTEYRIDRRALDRG